MSLNATDYDAAVQQRDALCARFDAVMARLVVRAGRRNPYAVNETTGELPANVVRPGDIEHLAQRFSMLHQYSDDIERVGMSIEEVEEYERMLQAERAWLLRANKAGDVSGYTDVVDGFLEAEGLVRPADDAVYHRLCRKLLQKHVSALRIIAERLEGDHEHPTPQCWPPLRDELDLDDIGVAVEHWRTKSQATSRTMDELMPFLTRLRAAMGVNRISELRAEDLQRFQAMERLRPSQRGPGFVLPQTVNKHFTLLKAVVNTAFKDQLAGRHLDNPLQSMSLLKVREQDVERTDAFSAEELSRIFTGPIYSQGVRPTGGCGEAAYWLFPLQRATGARLQEMTQLEVRHVVRVDGVYCLLLTKADDRGSAGTVLRGAVSAGSQEHDAAWDLHHSVSSEAPSIQVLLKSGNAQRLVPIHPQLIRLGFLDFVAWVHASGGKRLFPHIVPDSRERLTNNFAKWVNRYFKQVGVKREATDSRSFRHRVKSEFRGIRAEADVVDYVVGHAPGNPVAARYGVFPPPVVHQLLSQLPMPDLNLLPVWTPPQRHFVKARR